MLARAAGHRNLESLRAQRAPLRPAQAAAPLPLTLSPAARKALSQFNDRGVLQRWPHKHSVQWLALWVMWTRFEAHRLYNERGAARLLDERYLTKKCSR